MSREAVDIQMYCIGIVSVVMLGRRAAGMIDGIN